MVKDPWELWPNNSGLLVRVLAFDLEDPSLIPT